MKKILGLFIVLVLVISMFTACAKDETTENAPGDASTDSYTENVDNTEKNEEHNIVVGYYKEKPYYYDDIDYVISESDIGQSFQDMKKNAVYTYFRQLAIQDFFKDVVVEESDVDLEIQYYKEQAKRQDMEWEMYLALFIGLDEEGLTTVIRENLKPQKYIRAYMDNIELTDEEVLEYFEENADYYNNAVIDTLFFADEETYEKAVALVNDGKTLEEISEELDIEIYESEHIPINSEMTWSESLEDAEIGDLVYSLNTSSDITLAVGKVVDKHIGIDNEITRENVELDLKYAKASEKVNAEVIEFLKTQKAIVFGDEVALYIDR